NGVGVSGVIDGQGGTNTLDYSKYTTGVVGNLLAKTATGASSIARIPNVNGGFGNDLLVGDAQANVLNGNNGRDPLIGAAGADTLTAVAGDDILIGETTTYDSNPAALNAILAYWGRTDLTYAQRVSGLQAGVSYSDQTGTHTASLTASTVFDDVGIDTLTG